jgi:response regulator RpfG family c-di-GMP phosphodiesterase
MTPPQHNLNERRPRRVLCIDDDDDYLTILRMALRIPDAETLTASSTEEALERIRREPVDVIVTDIHMPGRSGYDLIGRARALGIVVVIVFVVVILVFVVFFLVVGAGGTVRPPGECVDGGQATGHSQREAPESGG